MNFSNQIVKSMQLILYSLFLFELKLRLGILEEKINQMLESNSNIIDCYQDIQLEQNIPNPFDGTTEIKCSIPEKYGKNLCLIISDATGTKKIQRISLKFGIENIINISAKDYETGAYIYGIEVDGKIVKSKKMLIIK